MCDKTIVVEPYRECGQVGEQQGPLKKCEALRADVAAWVAAQLAQDALRQDHRGSLVFKAQYAH
jgi:hypothetical protein